MARPFDLISFDFDGVILHNTFNEYYLGVARQLDLAWDPANEPELFRFFHDYWASELFRQESTQHDRREFLRIANRRFLEKLGVSEIGDDVLVRMAQVFDESGDFIDYYQETVVSDLLEDLKAQGYRIVMITNRGESVHRLLEEWNLLQFFEIVMLRDSAGAPKPSPAPFHYVNQALDIAPERSLHVGDGPYSDVRGAQNAGWTPLLLDPDDLFPDWEVPRIRSLRDLPHFLQP